MGYEVKKRSSFLELPPKGCYVAEIKGVRKKTPANDGVKREYFEVYVEITDGEYKGRYNEVYEDQRERFGDSVQYKGMLRLVPPDKKIDGEKYDFMDRNFGGNLYCIQESNDGEFDWDKIIKAGMTALKGKKVGINVRNRLYTYNGQDRQTTEICQFETVEDVLNGKVTPRKDRDQREKREESTDGSEFTDVSSNVDVPWA